MTRQRSTKDPEQVRAFAIECARTCSDMKCTEVLVLDVTGLSQVCDFIVIGTGTSDRQMRSVAQAMEDLGKERGDPPYRTNRDTATSWVVSDFVDVVVHLFESSQRMYYDIEALWKNGARVEWRRPEDDEPAVEADPTIA
ncbi:MAG: ribosome silencing factor [Planctomycetaceae bacterium]|nr:ribosome silencing factor [Planctomycetaceae bacterium]